MFVLCFLSKLLRAINRLVFQSYYDLISELFDIGFFIDFEKSYPFLLMLLQTSSCSNDTNHSGTALWGHTSSSVGGIPGIAGNKP